MLFFVLIVRLLLNDCSAMQHHLRNNSVVLHGQSKSLTSTSWAQTAAPTNEALRFEASDSTGQYLAATGIAIWMSSDSG